MMIVSKCIPYFRDLIAKEDEENQKILFAAACRILAPELSAVDASSFCSELGVSSDFIPLFDICMKNNNEVCLPENSDNFPPCSSVQ